MRKNLNNHLRSFNNGSPNLYIAIFVDEHHFFKLHHAALFGIDPVNEQFLVLLHFKLLTLNIYDYVHKK